FARAYIESPTVANLATLIRLSSVESWLLGRISPQLRARVREDLSGFFDAFHEAHLPLFVENASRLGADGRTLEGIAAPIEELFTPLRGAKRALSEWAEPLNVLLLSVFGARELSRGVPGERLIIDSCELLHEQLLACRDAAHEELPALSGAEAISLLLRQV